tara:strand:+ start:194 stop:478 length:285 start_codon:yes stop_codon:yes gene_type:complete
MFLNTGLYSHTIHTNVYDGDYRMSNVKKYQVWSRSKNAEEIAEMKEFGIADAGTFKLAHEGKLTLTRAIILACRLQKSGLETKTINLNIEELEA